MGNWSPRQQELVRGLILVDIVEFIVRDCRMYLYCLLPLEAAVSCCGHTDWGINSFYKEHVRAFTESLSPLPPAEKLCPAGQTYQNCSEEEDGLLSGRGVACEHTCESYLLNLTCSTHEPCVPGCSCPPG